MGRDRHGGYPAGKKTAREMKPPPPFVSRRPPPPPSSPKKADARCKNCGKCPECGR